MAIATQLEEIGFRTLSSFPKPLRHASIRAANNVRMAQRTFNRHKIITWDYIAVIVGYAVVFINSGFLPTFGKNMDGINVFFTFGTLHIYSYSR